MNVLFEPWVTAELRLLARQQGLTLKHQQPRDYLAQHAYSQQKYFNPA